MYLRRVLDTGTETEPGYGAATRSPPHSYYNQVSAYSASSERGTPLSFTEPP